MATAHHNCSVPGCHRPAGVPGTSKEYCSAHYMRVRRHGSPYGGRTPLGVICAWIAENIAFDGDDCLTWPFAISKEDGYGRVMHEGKIWVASRLMCHLAHGPAPKDGMDAAHVCGNGHLACVNPKHMIWKTRADNLADMVDHGTAVRGESASWSKLTEADVRKIRSLEGTVSQSEMAAMFGVSRGSVQDILRGRNWGWLK